MHVVLHTKVCDIDVGVVWSSVVVLPVSMHSGVLWRNDDRDRGRCYPVAMKSEQHLEWNTKKGDSRLCFVNWASYCVSMYITLAQPSFTITQLRYITIAQLELFHKEYLLEAVGGVAGSSCLHFSLFAFVHCNGYLPKDEATGVVVALTLTSSKINTRKTQETSASFMTSILVQGFKSKLWRRLSLSKVPLSFL